MADICVKNDEINSISPRILCLIDNLNNLSSKAMNVLQAKYVNFLPAEGFERFCFEKNAKTLQGEYQCVAELYQDGKIATNLVVSNSNFGVCLKLVNCNASLNQAAVFVKRYQLDRAVQLFDETLNCLDELSDDDHNKWREIIYSMRSYASLKRSLCLSKLCTEWEESLKWDERQNGDKITLCISIKEYDVDRTKMVMQSLVNTKRFEIELVAFAQCFIDKILLALLKKSCVISCDENMNFVHLVIEHSSVDTENISVHTFVENLMAVFEFLQSKLSFVFDDGSTFLSILSKLISKKFFMFINDQFERAIPSNVTQSAEFAEIISEISHLHAFLIEIKFTSESTSPLNKYIKPTVSLIHKKKCDGYLMEAKRILSQNLQQRTLAINSDDHLDKTVFSGCDPLTSIESPFLLPDLKISSNAKELMHLVLQCLREAGKSTDGLSADLVLTAKNIFSTYSCLVPYCQEQNLKNSALDVALFYNNCYYLSHCMLSAPWGVELDENLTKYLKIFMANEINILKNIGDNIFAEFVKAENKFIIEQFSRIDMTSTDLSCGLPILDETITTVHCRLSSLRRQWLSVLAAETYAKTMEDLLKSVGHSVLECLFRVDREGIDAESSNALAISLETALHTPQVVVEDDVKFRKPYAKLKEAVELLSYPRRAIFEERLSSGTAWKTFTKAEAKFLVKLVFPPGADRSALIAYIN